MPSILKKMRWMTHMQIVMIMVKVMGTPPRSPPHSDGHLEATSRKSRQSTMLRRLTLRTKNHPRPTTNVDPVTGRGSGPHKEKFHNYLGKLARTKRYGQMTSQATHEISDKITTQGNFVPHGCDDILNAIGRPEHAGRVRAARSGRVEE
ncbi:hypothetical protein GmHk_13G036585 [Glycine max]|nr:hypothetical protein GmHk_13G036585 [Glycine max]KAH1215443.1 hypothetical protein GmHk_13G036585 [Glycine max]